METTTEFAISTSLVTKEDVDQEVQYLALRKGIPAQRISRHIVRMKLQRQQLLTYGIMPNASAWSPPELDPEVSVYIIDQLINWAYDTGNNQVIELMLKFLENPEARLKSTLENLDELGFLPHITSTSTGKDKVKQTLSRLFENAIPAFKDDLINIVVRNSPQTERPAATVRQWLRRMEKQHKIEVGTDGRYYWRT